MEKISGLASEMPTVSVLASSLLPKWMVEFIAGR
jgi:hypothetical protein